MPDSIRNTNTLQKIAAEITSRYEGWYCSRIVTYDKDVYDLHIESSSHESLLRIDISPVYSSIYILSHKPRYKHTTNIFPQLEGLKLKGCKVLRYDRIVKFDFGKYNIIINVFGRGASGFYILNAKHNILFQKGKPIESGQYELPAPPEEKYHDPTKYPLRWPKHYIEEYYHINNIVDAKQVSDFHEEISTSSKFYVYYNKHYLFSSIRLSNSDSVREFLSPSLAIEYIVTRSKYEEKYSRLHSYLISETSKRKKKLEKKIETFSDIKFLAIRANNYRLYGDILMSRPDIKSIKSKIDTQDWEGNDILIPLDDKLTLLDNAKRFYEKSKNLERTALEHQEMLPLLEEQLFEILGVEELLAAKPKIKELENMQKSLRWLQGQNFAKKKKEDKFRKFELHEGVYLFVGKSAANNDELTNHFAKPQDIWLHAKDVSGSHGVIKGISPDRISKEMLERAGSIISYYSSARNQSYVPVSYTQKKYVRKPKGATVGAVIMTREDVIFVEPGLPK